MSSNTRQTTVNSFPGASETNLIKSLVLTNTSTEQHSEAVKKYKKKHQLFLRLIAIINTQIISHLKKEYEE